MGDSYRDYVRAKKKKRTQETRYEARTHRDRSAAEARSKALKRQQSRKEVHYGKKATQGRLLDA